MNIDLGVLSAGDPENAIDHIHELFVYLLDIATLLSDKIGLVDISGLQLNMSEEQIKFENILYYIERTLRKARP